MYQLINKYESYFAPAGRILMGAFFFLDGFSKVTGIEGAAGYTGSVGLPAPTLLAWVAGLFLIVAGGALIANYHGKLATCLLTLFVILVTLLFHSPTSWATDTSGIQQIMFMKNIAILSGLLFMTTHLKK